MSYKLPEYITNYKFDSAELKSVFDDGTTNNNIDKFGNYILKPELPDAKQSVISDQLIVVGSTNTNISADLVEQYYDTSFSEFTDHMDASEDISAEQAQMEIESDVEDQLRREGILSTQVDELVNALERETQRGIKFQEDAERNYKATKQMMIELRIKNGEGTSERDFNDAFPFLPKTDTTSEFVENSPFVMESDDM